MRAALCRQASMQGAGGCADGRVLGEQRRSDKPLFCQASHQRPRLQGSRQRRAYLWKAHGRCRGVHRRGKSSCLAADPGHHEDGSRFSNGSGDQSLHLPHVCAPAVCRRPETRRHVWTVWNPFYPKPDLVGLRRQGVDRLSGAVSGNASARTLRCGYSFFPRRGCAHRGLRLLQGDGGDASRV